MSRPEQDANPFDPSGQWKAMRDSSMEAWSKTMQEFVQSDAYTHASAEWLDANLTTIQLFQKVIDQAMTEALRQVKIPSTADIMGLAERMSNIEFRIDDLDARLDEIVRLLKGLTDTTATLQQTLEKVERVAERTSKELQASAVGEAGTKASPVEPVSAQVGQATGEGLQPAESEGEQAKSSHKGRAHHKTIPPEAPGENVASERQEQE